MTGKPVVKSDDTIRVDTVAGPATLFGMPGGVDLAAVPVPGTGGFLIGGATVTVPDDIAALKVPAQYQRPPSVTAGDGVVSFALADSQLAGRARTGRAAPVPVVVHAGKLTITFTVGRPATDSQGSPVDTVGTAYTGTASFAPRQPTTVFAG
ncbi:hypothetical protein ACFVUN_06215 [Kitasatospora griseola]|uniref:hypothetical protein n=1 Tax=Kitasatospora griseola TaxID=2064 RepID=UPI0036DB73A2